MKVLIFDSTPLKQAPYLQYYEQILKEKGIPYHICTWDKTCDGEIIVAGAEMTIRSKWHLGKRKYIDFIKISRILNKIINEGKYTHLVIVNTIWAMLLRQTLLRDFSGRYIIDIRDYKCETLPGYQFFLKKLIENSYFTTVSSDGFRTFLPVSDKIIPNHNITNVEAAADRPTFCAHKEKVCLGFIGYIRYRKENEMLIRKVGGEERFSLYYRGVFSEGCQFDKNPELQFDNVIYGAPFVNSEKPELYRRIDMIHSAYGGDGLAQSTLLPNRLYDAIIFKKPMLVSPNTFLSRVVEKYHLGVSLDLEDPDFMQKLNEYVDSFDEKKFLAGCAEFADTVNEQQRDFINKIYSFLSE